MTAGASTSELPMKTIMGIIIVRLCALPVIGMMMIKIAHDFGFLPEDPLFRFVLMVQYTMPTAMNVGPYSLTPRCPPTQSTFEAPADHRSTLVMRSSTLSSARRHLNRCRMSLTKTSFYSSSILVGILRFFNLCRFASKQFSPSASGQFVLGPRYPNV